MTDTQLTLDDVTAPAVCWADHRQGGPCRRSHDGDALVTWGRCRSGKRWFWYAVRTFSSPDDSHYRDCTDPACWGAGPHEHGWEGTEDAAVSAARAAAGRLAAGQPAYGSASHGMAADVLKRVNAARRRARPPSGTAQPQAVEYLYVPCVYTPYDDSQAETRRWIAAVPIVKKTAKRIYYDVSDSWESAHGAVRLGFIDRQAFEADTRCASECPRALPAGLVCAEHGYTWQHCPHGQNPCRHGYPAGQIRIPGDHRRFWHGSQFFATREAAEEDLHGAQRERDRTEAEPEIRRLRMEMAGAHPDRGGTSDEFIAARKRYEHALRRTA